jgi:hypothetical protein
MRIIVYIEETVRIADIRHPALVGAVEGCGSLIDDGTVFYGSWRLDGEGSGWLSFDGGIRSFEGAIRFYATRAVYKPASRANSGVFLATPRWRVIGLLLGG